MSSSKINVAKQAIDYIKDKLHPEMILGIGTGSTVNFFIEELGAYKNLFAGAVSSSEASSNLLNEKGIKIDDKVFKEEKGVLEDLIVAAINNAKKAVESKTQEEMSKLTGDLKLPPGIKLPF